MRMRVGGLLEVILLCRACLVAGTFLQATFATVCPWRYLAFPFLSLGSIPGAAAFQRQSGDPARNIGLQLLTEELDTSPYARSSHPGHCLEECLQAVPVLP